MFGLDDKVASFSDGTTLLVVAAVAVLLGLRHASDPDHLAAVTTLLASGRERAARQAARLGLAWGLGHATSLFLFGLPVVLYSAYLPAAVQRAAETTVGFVIVALAVVLLARWHRGLFRDERHEHDGDVHTHLHSRRHAHVKSRTARGAYAIGLVHGMGGTAGIGLLLLAAIHSHVVAVVALALFAFCTAASMALLSTGFGLALGTTAARRCFHHVAPALGLASLLFGVWYALGAQNLVPYAF
jgi:high-affinity nickel permease